MAKVWCATIECKYNKENQCRAQSVSFSDGHIHTVHQGYKHIWQCSSYEMSERAKTLAKMLNGEWKTNEVD